MAYWCIDPVSGSDGTGSSQATQAAAEATPFATFVTGVRPSYAAGDTVLFKGGTTASEVITNNKDNTTFSSYGTGRATIAGDGATAWSVSLNGTGVTVENLNITGGTTRACIAQLGSDYCTIRNCDIYEGAFDGLIVNTSSNVTVENVNVYNNPRYGFRAEGSGSNESGLIVRNSKFYNNGSSETVPDNFDGFFIGNGHIGFIVEDCQAYNNGALGIGFNFDFSAGSGGEDCIGVVRRCYAHTGYGGFGVSGTDAGITNTNDVTIENCISLSHVRGNYETHGCGNMKLYNCYSGGPVPDGVLTNAAQVKLGDTTIGATTEIVNTIIEANEYPHAIAYDPTYTTLTSKNNCIVSGTLGISRNDTTSRTFSEYVSDVSDTGSISSDPLLDDNGFPASTSPCLNAGAAPLSQYDAYSRPNYGNHIGAVWPKINTSKTRRSF